LVYDVSDTESLDKVFAYEKIEKLKKSTIWVHMVKFIVGMKKDLVSDSNPGVADVKNWLEKQNREDKRKNINSDEWQYIQLSALSEEGFSNFRKELRRMVADVVSY